MKNTKAYVIAFSGVSVAMNIILGIITSALGIPLYLDTLGTVLTAVLIGPLPAVIVGSLSNIITGFIYSVTDIPFFIVNAAIGLIVGLVAKRKDYTLPVAIILGLILSIVAPVIGTPIGILVYGGLNGTWSDIMIAALKQAGYSIFAASFLRNIASNLVDKIGTCIVAWAIIKALPMRLKDTFQQEKAS